ncbi:MAG: DNA primase [Pseudomonadota bacterium]
MSLPPGFLDELRARTSISSVIGRKVTWDQRKSNQAKGDMWAPCPFHQEKTASFHVDDRKGYYHCFGCHAKGDAISFVRETENVGFMEAVEILAQEAGMTLPARDPKAQEKADRRSQLSEVMEQAVRFFRLQLNTGAATEARTYLDRRGLSTEAQERWEVGFAPDAWQALWDHLKAKNVADDMILDAGLAKPSNRGGKPYDTFRGRIMFPIRDVRGRAIAFGGRAVDPGENAKYLNSPETMLFDKGSSLFNHGPARTAAGAGQQLIVAEGYMDVIALSEFGFEAAVAPLGTAVTETQLQMMWRISPEPVIALDGDTAGLRAAMRLIDLALPLLTAGQSLRFALMPDGQDPDDLLRSKGTSAVARIVDSALPMVQLLWRRETEDRTFDSPERKAALEKVLREKCALIKDPTIRSHYERELKDLQWQLFRRPSRPRSGMRLASQFLGVRQTTKTSALLSTDPEYLNEAVVLSALVCCPAVIRSVETELEEMRCADPVHADLRTLLLRNADLTRPELRREIERHLGSETIENLLSQSHLAVVPCIRHPENREMTEMTVAEVFAKLSAARGLNTEIKEAQEDLNGQPDEGVTWRLSEAVKAADRAQRSAREDGTEYEIGENGARINRDERNALDALLQSIRQEKPPD